MDALNPVFCVLFIFILKANISSYSEGTFAISDKCTCMEITIFLPSDSDLKLFYSGSTCNLHLI
jgi:hypothetical protein